MADRDGGAEPHPARTFGGDDQSCSRGAETDHEDRLTRSDTLAFFRKGSTHGGANHGCLLMHGFTGTPQEMRFLGEHLYSGGHAVNVVRLAGHCTSIDEFERSTWLDWYGSARAGMEELRQDTPRVVAIGQSMGALLALKLAVDYPHAIVGVVLLAPALVLANPWVRRIGPALPWLVPLLRQRTKRIQRGERDVADRQARTQSPGYRQVPLQALHQLVMLQKHVRRLLPQVQQPALVIHSRQDHTCPPSNVSILERSLGGPVRSVLLENSFHVISIDVDKEQVAAEVAAFIGSGSGSIMPAMS
jgi:carboxylesterase